MKFYEHQIHQIWYYVLLRGTHNYLKYWNNNITIYLTTTLISTGAEVTCVRKIRSCINRFDIMFKLGIKIIVQFSPKYCLSVSSGNIPVLI